MKKNLTVLLFMVITLQCLDISGMSSIFPKLRFLSTLRTSLPVEKIACMQLKGAKLVFPSSLVSNANTQMIHVPAHKVVSDLPAKKILYDELKGVNFSLQSSLLSDVNTRIVQAYFHNVSPELIEKRNKSVVENATKKLEDIDLDSFIKQVNFKKITYAKLNNVNILLPDYLVSDENTLTMQVHFAERLSDFIAKKNGSVVENAANKIENIDDWNSLIEQIESSGEYYSALRRYYDCKERKEEKDRWYKKDKLSEKLINSINLALRLGKKN